MKNKSIYIFILIVISGCTAQNRINRIAKNHNLTFKDTIVVHDIDTLIIPEYRFDTITTMVFQETTLVVKEDRVHLRYFYDTVTNSIFHDIHLPADTSINKEDILVPVDRISLTNENVIPWYVWVVVGLLILLAILLVRKR